MSSSGGSDIGFSGSNDGEGRLFVVSNSLIVIVELLIMAASSSILVEFMVATECFTQQSSDCSGKWLLKYFLLF